MADTSGGHQATLETTLARIADSLSQINNHLSKISDVLSGASRDGPIAGMAENLQKIREQL
jgi:hypothetical protein